MIRIPVSLQTGDGMLAGVRLGHGNTNSSFLGVLVSPVRIRRLGVLQPLFDRLVRPLSDDSINHCRVVTESVTG